MTGRTHAVVGANTVWLLPLVGLSAHPAFLALGALAGLVPDLDASESTIKHLGIPLRIGGVRFRIKPFFLPAFLLSRMFKHRGWLHSAIAVILVALLSQVAFGSFGAEIPFSITAGYLFHILTDMLTKEGVQFALPLRERFRLLPTSLGIHTNGWLDHTLFAFGSLGILAFAFFWAQANGGAG